MKDCSRWLDQR